MQEKCSFLLAHVEITPILAVFLDASGSKWKGIVEAHGGPDAECEHTRFVVTLPKAVTAEKKHAVTGSLVG